MLTLCIMLVSVLLLLLYVFSDIELVVDSTSSSVKLLLSKEKYEVVGSCWGSVGVFRLVVVDMEVLAGDTVEAREKLSSGLSSFFSLLPLVVVVSLKEMNFLFF